MPRHPDAIYRPFHPLEGDQTFAVTAANGNALRIVCWPCEHIAHIDGPDLVRRFGGDCTIRRLSGRMVCAECGSRQVLLHVVGTMGHPQRPGSN